MIDDLVKELVNSNKRILIQTHDFPDPDAVATAFGLQNYFSIYNIATEIVYSGDIQRDALKHMIIKLNIKITKDKNIELNKEDLIIIVDGCKGNKNVTDLPGSEIAVIDHHIVKEPEDVPFIEIDEKLGSCSTIITSYFIAKDLPIPINVASALKIGISRDTDLLTRKVTSKDIDAYHYLYQYAENNLVNSFLRNNIQLSDFKFFSKTIGNLNTYKTIAWYFFEEGCETNLMGILGDFILSAQEINLSMLFAKNSDSISISIRNENPDWSAADSVRLITKDIGAGGGHNEMAAGVIFTSKGFSTKEAVKRIINSLYD